ncbi:MAG: adenine nucleotide alpha hydrolase [Phycisphaerales bacterium]|nr:adenine nucleotide alpha hydrolase [Phycisphaerales bacterium]
MGKINVVLSWSGGKDSAMVLHELRRDDRYKVVELLTSVSEEYRRISHHGVRETLLDAQAAAIGLPLRKIYLPSNNGKPCTNDTYEAIMRSAMEAYKARGISTVAFGDLYLEDLRQWRQGNLARVGMQAVFPVWGRPPMPFSREVIALGVRAYLSCVEDKMGKRFAGREYNSELLAELPEGICPCGENGEFHSFVFAGPIFSHPLDVVLGQYVLRDGRHYVDLLLRQQVAAAATEPAVMPPV